MQNYFHATYVKYIVINHLDYDIELVKGKYTFLLLDTKTSLSKKLSIKY